MAYYFFFTDVVNFLLLGCVKSYKEWYLPLAAVVLEYLPAKRKNTAQKVLGWDQTIAPENYKKQIKGKVKN